MHRIAKLVTALACLVVVPACEGPMGPEGPAGPQGPEGPEGAQGPAGGRWEWSQGVTGADGLAVGSFAGYSLQSTTVNCWTRETPSQPWIALASAGDPVAPDGVIGCAAQQDGGTLQVGVITYANWEFLIVAISTGS